MADTDETDAIEAARTAILERAVPAAAFDGWTRRTILNAAEEAGIDAGLAGIAFPGGATDLIEAFVVDADRKMVEAAKSLPLADMRVRDKIAAVVRLRLEENTIHKEAIRRALSVLAMPQNATLNLRLLYGTVDAMWRAIGDTSTDHNFYSKRFILSGVYSATLLFWLNDRSEGSTATWEFLDRRIENVMQIENLKGRMPGLQPVMEAPFRLIAQFRYPSFGRRAE